MMNKSTVVLIIIILGILIMLGYMASLGLMLPTMALFALYTVIIFMSGVLSTIYTVRVMQAKEQESFMNNAKENMAIMSQMQKVQNLQSNQLLKQANQSSYHPVINGDIFDDLLELPPTTSRQ